MVRHAAIFVLAAMRGLCAKLAHFTDACDTFVATWTSAISQTLKNRNIQTLEKRSIQTRIARHENNETVF